MKRKIMLFICVMIIWCSMIVFASASTSKIKVAVNGINIGEVGALIDSTTYLPLRKIGESLNAIVEWDASSKSALIYKPNVHMFVYNSSNGAETTFGEVSKGFNGKFKIFAQVDNIAFKLSAVRFTITDPSGKETVIQRIAVDKDRDNYWFVTDETSYRFSASGKYTIRCYMQTEFSEDWVLTSEKLITST
jgi:hypothetical protein